MGINVLSLFDGQSCGRQALKELGIEVDNYFASEIDENAITISKHNHDDIIQLGDVENYKDWELPKIDLLIGGSPCQGFSRNGKMLNFDDPRSKLFFKYVEILEDLRKKNPNIKFMLENVEMKKEWVEVISNYLGVNAVLINSKLLSAQNRPRLYWTNICELKPPNDKGVILKDILDLNTDTSNFIEKDGILLDSSFSEKEINLISVVNNEVRIKQATKQGYIIAEGGDGVNLQFPTSKTRRGRVVKQKSSTLDCQCNVCVYYDGIIRRLNINELERLQTLPDGYTKCVNERLAKKAIGNGWTVEVIKYILSFLNKGDED